jgi:hypothetical protein
VVRSDGARPHGALRGQRALASPPGCRSETGIGRHCVHGAKRHLSRACHSRTDGHSFLSYRRRGRSAARGLPTTGIAAPVPWRCAMPQTRRTVRKADCGPRCRTHGPAAGGMAFVALPQKEGRKTMTHAFDGDDLFAPVSYGGGGGGRDPDGGGRGYGGWSRNNCRRPRGLAEGGTALSAFDVNCNGNPWDDISLGASLVGGGVSVAARSAVSAVISGVGIGASFAGEHWSREN